jgi:hypothetical protein
MNSTIQYDKTRDKIWNATYNTYYLVYWYENIADNLVKKWSSINDIIKIFIACTASSSAISGIAFWQTEQGKNIWIVLVTIAGFLSILNLTLKVDNKIKEWTDIKNNFVNLRFKAEILKDKMSFNPTFDIIEFEKEFLKLKEDYGISHKQLKPDYFIRPKLISRTQEKVNNYIKNYSN